jgi:glucokinase
MKQFSLGVDIGGSHISCALVDMFEGRIVPNSHTEMNINNKASADEILDGWKLALSSTISKAGNENVGGIGFAMPGPFAYDKGIALFDEKVDKFEKLNGVNVCLEMTKRLDLDSQIPVRFMKDASAFALGEAWL